MALREYQIVETSSGPMISHSRVSVFDVLEADENGMDMYEICQVYELTPRQVQTALDYITKFRERLLPILHDIQRKAAEREVYYTALALERLKQIEESPMTPERAALYTLIAQNREEREKNGYNGDDTE